MSEPARGGVGKLKFILLLVVLAGIAHLFYYGFTGGVPEIHLSREIRGIGQSSELTVNVSDRRGLRAFEVALEQDGKTIPILAESYGSRWSLMSSGPTQLSRNLELGTEHQKALQDGTARLLIRASNRKWFGGESEVNRDVVVRSRPPTIQVLSGLLYVNQGGSEMLLYRVSDFAIESGVRVGKYFFPGFPLPGVPTGKDSSERIALFAFPYDLPVDTPAQVLARDDAGNEALSNFPHQVIAKNFRSRDIQIDDAFLQAVVPPIMANTPEIHDQGSLLKNFLELNGKLREMNRAQIATVARQTAPRMLWDGPFLQLANSAVESQFADFRTYYYRGQKVDQQTHLGFDLASVQHASVKASNDGVVVFAAYLGIFGNSIILDHGLGLQTLYSHLSSFEVNPGDKVAKGQEIAKSGSTGMAGGDHLHFTTLLDGVEVNPIEWWDERWVRQHILQKLPTGMKTASTSTPSR